MACKHGGVTQSVNCERASRWRSWQVGVGGVGDGIVRDGVEIDVRLQRFRPPLRASALCEDHHFPPDVSVCPPSPPALKLRSAKSASEMTDSFDSSQLSTDQRAALRTFIAVTAVKNEYHALHVLQSCA